MTTQTKIAVARRQILKTNGGIFSATVEKRSGGTREITAKTFEDTGNARDMRNNMLTVVDVHKTRQRKRKGKHTPAYRCISLEGVHEIRFRGKKLRFSDV